jgi:hypothetical protein
MVAYEMYCPVCGRSATHDGSVSDPVVTVVCPTRCGRFRVAPDFMKDLESARRGVGLLASRLPDLSRAIASGRITELLHLNQVTMGLDRFLHSEETTE